MANSDIPILEQQEGIAEGGGLPSFASMGSKPVPNARAPHLESSLADFQYYNNYARQGANELGEMLGTMRGQKPGGFIIPPIFDSQRSFNEAYKHEEFQNLNFEGSQALRKMQNEVIKNPTLQNINKYQQEGSDLVEQLINTATPSNQPQLKRSLKGQYETDMLGLSDALYNKTQQEALAHSNVIQMKVLKIYILVHLIKMKN